MKRYTKTLRMNGVGHNYLIIGIALMLTCSGGCLCFFADPVVPHEISDLFLNKDKWLAVNLRIQKGVHDPALNSPDAPFLKAGTKVRVVRLSMSDVELADLDTGNRFRILVRRGELPYDVWLYRYLSDTDINDLLSATSTEEMRQTILEGKILIGMTIQEVIMAWGFPPGIDYPEEMSQWSFPRKSGETTVLRFENGILKEIR